MMPGVFDCFNFLNLSFQNLYIHTDIHISLFLSIDLCAYIMALSLVFLIKFLSVRTSGSLYLYLVLGPFHGFFSFYLLVLSYFNVFTFYLILFYFIIILSMSACFLWTDRKRVDPDESRGVEELGGEVGR